MCRLGGIHCSLRLLPLRRGPRSRPRGNSIDILYARGGATGRQIVEQWVVALHRAKEVGVRFSCIAGFLNFN